MSTSIEFFKIKKIVRHLGKAYTIDDGYVYTITLISGKELVVTDTEIEAIFPQANKKNFIITQLKDSIFPPEFFLKSVKKVEKEESVKIEQIPGKTLSFAPLAKNRVTILKCSKFCTRFEHCNGTCKNVDFIVNHTL